MALTWLFDFTKWVTTKEASDGEFGPDNDTMTPKGFLGVLGAGGREAAGKGIAKKGTAQGVVVG